MEPASPVELGRYTLLERRASNGFVECWLARVHGALGRDALCNLKRLTPQGLDEPIMLEGFSTECWVGMLLRHPNLVQTLEHGQVDGAPFVAQSLLLGVSLRTLFDEAQRRGETIGDGLAVHIVRGICRGLSHMHAARSKDGDALGLVHRETTLPTLLLCDDGVPRIPDFGVVQTYRSQHEGGILRGRFGYMSPEQVMGAPLDGRTDLFALGIVLYELCTGTRLFQADSDLKVLEMITRHPIPPPSARRPSLSHELERIILRALERPLEQRFQSAAEMERMLGAWAREHDQNLGAEDAVVRLYELAPEALAQERQRIERALASDTRFPVIDGRR